MKHDIHNIIKRLIRANINDSHAEAIAKEINNSTQQMLKDGVLDIKLKALVAHFEARLELMKSELLKWFIGVGLMQTTTFIIMILIA